MTNRGLIITLLALAPFLGTLFLGILSSSARAQEPADVQDLERRNAELEQRVQSLERKQMDREIETYLDNMPLFTEAQGDEKVAPGTERFRITGQVAIRGEIRDHLYTDDRPDAGRSFNLVLQRTRIGFEADVLENLGVTIELQDIRYWGEEQSTVGMINNVDLKQGFIDIRNIGGKPVDVQAGRMMVWYDDQRLVGHLEWVPQGRTYDGVRVQVHAEKWHLDVYGFKIRDALSVDDDENFFGIHGGMKMFDVYGLLKQDQLDKANEQGGTGNSLFFTFGFRIHGSKGAFDYKLEVPFQFGKLNGDDLNAWAAALTLGWNFENAGWQPRVYVEINYASGDKDSTDGDVEQFQTLYPTNHLYYGYADQVGWENLFNVRVGILLKPTPKWRIRIDYHYFDRPEEQGNWGGAGGRTIRTGQAGASSHLGDEIDLVVTWLPSKPLSLEFGWAVFLPGGFVEDTGDSPTSHFVYLQCKVVF